MRPILIFAGTTEGRELAERLAKNRVPCRVCVATEYGSRSMPEHEQIRVHEGRMNRQEMEALMRKERFGAVVDATHPFATEVTQNIKESAAAAGVCCLRLQRSCERGENAFLEKDCFYQSNEQCVQALIRTEGNILLTTGSKALPVYCQNQELKERLYVRVLPGKESLSVCWQQQIAGSRILALQGPFSQEMNRLFLREYEIRHLVTKESGRAGGFMEKVEAAHREGVRLHIIGNPERTKGLSFSQVCRELERITGRKLTGALQVELTLAGAGMGSPEGRTAETEKLIREADLLFGAKRLLEGLKAKAGKLPYYQAEDILPLLEKQIRETEADKGLRVGILFSGDSGFYSGSAALYERLLKWKEQTEEEGSVCVHIRVLPGISSVSAFAAALRVSWQDACIRSIHGKKEMAQWQGDMLECAAYHEKTFLLLSDREDLRRVGELLKENGLSHCRLFYGCGLSYPDEKIGEITPGENLPPLEEGLYICLIRNEHAQRKKLTPGIADEEFLRGKSPMTKEEVRHAAIARLGLYEGGVVYDIGSGTGSVAIEIASCHPSLQVYAIEQKEQAAELIRQNCRRFHTEQIHVIWGKAPKALEELPAPTHVFIGGSGGNLREILAVLKKKNPGAQLVMTAVSLETLCEVTESCRELSISMEEAVQLQVSRAKEAGSYHLMQAENPVYIFRLAMEPEKEGEQRR